MPITLTEWWWTADAFTNESVIISPVNMQRHFWKVETDQIMLHLRKNPCLAWLNSRQLIKNKLMKVWKRREWMLFIISHATSSVMNFGLLGLTYNIAVDQVSAPLLPSGKWAGPAGVPTHLTHNRWPTFHAICQGIESSHQQPQSNKSPVTARSHIGSLRLPSLPLGALVILVTNKAAPCNAAWWRAAAMLLQNK